MKNYICKCEVCKAERVKNREAREQDRQRVLEMRLTEDADESLGRRVRELAQRHLDAVWASADGRITRVQAMSRSHLCFALAKCYRGEVSWHATRSQGVLESELLRRLAGVAGTDRQQAAHEREAAQRSAREALEDSLAWGRG